MEVIIRWLPIVFIASGSKDDELNYLCMEQGIDLYFVQICCSPMENTDIVRSLLERHHIGKDDVVLIRDAINDYDAAKANGISFAGYNNPKLREVADEYIDSFACKHHLIL